MALWNGGVAPASAAYNANLAGNLTSLLTYTGGHVLFTLANQPSANGTSNASYFELDPPGTAGADIPDDSASKEGLKNRL